MHLRLVIIFALFISVRVFAQSGFCASGGQINGDGGSVSFTCGQFIQETFSVNSTSISHGLQQPIEMLVLSGNIEPFFNLPSIKIFPNPATDKIQISFSDLIKSYSVENIKIEFINMDGKIIMSLDISNQTEMIDIAFLPAGIYFIHFIFVDNHKYTFSGQTHQLIKK
jgi:hypothetical protein